MRNVLAGFIAAAATTSVGMAFPSAQAPAAQAPAGQAPAGGGGRGPSGPQMRGDGPAPASKPFNITRVDPSLDAIISPNATAEVMASGFGINEGVIWIREGNSGYILVSSLIDNVMYKITPDHKVSVFMEKAGYSGNDPNHVGMQTRAGRTHVIIIGPNCAVLDPQGRLVWCASQDYAVKRLEKDGTRTVLADSFEGKHFNGPNDIAIKSDGAIYIADSDVGLRDGGRSPLKQMPTNVWLWKDGKVTMVLAQESLGASPNGIVLSPDEKYLYLTAGRRLKRYEVKPDDTLGEGTIFAEGEGITDGMKVDRKGNIYSTSGAGPGVIRITSPEGKLLGLLNLPIAGDKEPKQQICATNVAFGGDGRDLYVSACDVVYKIRLQTSGIISGPDGKMVSSPTPTQ
jgi:gluconolactonase